MAGGWELGGAGGGPLPQSRRRGGRAAADGVDTPAQPHARHDGRLY